MKKLFILFTFSSFLNILAFADIINVPGDYSTIQEGINAATTSDTVLIADGVYTGELNRNLSWNGNEKHITVKSENGPENCWINCQQSDRAFSFINTYQDSTDVIEGFTIHGGYVYWNYYGGGAICCYFASPKIVNNVIIENHASETHGGGFFLNNSSSKIIGNIIQNNSATYGGFPGSVCGGGIYVNSSSVLIKNNVIADNSVTSTDFEASSMGGGIYVYSSDIVIINNLLKGNGAYASGGSRGGGINLWSCNNLAQVTNNTIFDNTAASGSGINCHWVELTNNIIANNSQEGIRCWSPQQIPVITFNNVWGNPINFINCPTGIGDTSWGSNINGTACDSCFNISEDPVFTSYLEDDFFLSQIEAGQNVQSPCVDAGSGVPADYGLENYTTRTDLIWDDGIVDMGFHYPGIILQGIEEIFVYSAFNYKLSNYPNPFNPSTTISFSVPEERHAELSIYNIKGQKVKTLVSDQLPAGQHSVVWDGRDSSGKEVSSGIYFYKLKAGDFEKVRKMILLK